VHGSGEEFAASFREIPDQPASAWVCHIPGAAADPKTSVA